MGDLLMSKKERKRHVVMDQVLQNQITLKDATSALGISYRQCKRIWKRYKENGAEGLIHKSRGRESNRKTPNEIRSKIIKRYQDRYYDFGPTLASEYLANDGFTINSETLRRWLIKEGLWTRKRKRKRHRTRRAPRKRFGQLIQMDGSIHEWFEGRRGKACLMNLVDDATKKTLSFMAEEETTFAAMEVLERWIRRYGVPEALYCDLKSLYQTTREATIDELIAGKEPLSQFGRACDELGIKIIPAYSAQAKGRVERNHGVYQDRFIKELRLQNAVTIEEANAILDGGFIALLNKKFARNPADMLDAHIPLKNKSCLRNIFCKKTERTLSGDWVVRHQGRFFQVLKKQKELPPPRAKITVAEYKDKSINLIYKNNRLTFVEIDYQGKEIEKEKQEM